MVLSKMKLVSILLTMMMIFAPMEEEDLTVLTIKAISDTYPTWAREYEFGVFDCSEMSAYVSYCLNTVGVENEIVMGKNGRYYHAWVETDHFIIESTTLAMYGERNIYFQGRPKWNYTMYDVVIVNKREDDWDWWNSPIFIEE